VISGGIGFLNYRPKGVRPGAGVGSDESGEKKVDVGLTYRVQELVSGIDDNDNGMKESAHHLGKESITHSTPLASAVRTD
jgi:hypothetical protein